MSRIKYYDTTTDTVKYADSVSMEIPTITVTTSQIIATNPPKWQLTNDQAALVEDPEIKFIHFYYDVPGYIQDYTLSKRVDPAGEIHFEQITFLEAPTFGSLDYDAELKQINANIITLAESVHTHETSEMAENAYVNSEYAVALLEILMEDM